MLTRGLLGLLCGSLAMGAQAEEFKPIRLSLGYYTIFNADTTVSISERSAGVGVAINPADTFGTDLEQDAFRLDLRYRFTPDHSLNLTWYRLSNRGTNALEHSVDWVDEDGNDVELSAGTTVQTHIANDILKINYMWSFYHNDKVELYTSVGLHGSAFRVDLDVASNVGGSGDHDVRKANSKVPLPNVGIGIEYDINPKLSWYLRADVFALAYDDWNGTFTDISAGMEYQLIDYLALGIGLGSTNTTVTETNKDYRFEYDNRLMGLNFYVSSEF